MTVKEQKSAFGRGKYGQVVMEERKSGSGRAEMWQWKSRKVTIEEQISGNGIAVMWQWKSEKVPLKEQNLSM